MRLRTAPNSITPSCPCSARSPATTPDSIPSGEEPDSTSLAAVCNLTVSSRDPESSERNAPLRRLRVAAKPSRRLPHDFDQPLEIIIGIEAEHHLPLVFPVQLDRHPHRQFLAKLVFDCDHV